MARNQVAIISQMSTIAGDDSIMVCDVATGNMICTYKLPVKCRETSLPILMIGRHCIDRIGYQYLICAYQNSPVVNVWNLQHKDSLHSKMIMPGNVSSLAVSSDGSYSFMAIQTKLYIWQNCSGYLVNVLDKHYQTIRVVRITNDMSYCITGADDGLVIIWNLEKCLLESNKQFSIVQCRSSEHEPEVTIRHSSMSILDIHIGPLHSSNRQRFIVCSEQSAAVKLYELCTGKLLATITLPSPIVSLLMDRIERSFYCGSIDGNVFQVHIGLHHSFENLSTDGDLKADSFNQFQTFSGHNGAVCSIAITIDGQGLMTGSNDKTIRLWHIATRQCIRNIQCKGPVSNLFICPSMSGLFIFDSLDNYSMINNMDFSNQIDISLEPNRTSKQSRFQSLYSRPQSIEQTLRMLPNGPVSIHHPFQRDRFRLRFNPIDLVATSSLSHGFICQTNDSEVQSTMLNAFDNGSCIWFRNDQSSAKEFWPWNNYQIPDLPDDLANFYPQKQIDQEIMEHLQMMKQKTTKTSKKNNKKTPIGLNEDDDLLSNSMVHLNYGHNHQTTDDEIGRELNPSSSKTMLSDLYNANYSLYSYAIDKIFKNISNGHHNKPKEKAHNPTNDDIQFIQLDDEEE